MSDVTLESLVDRLARVERQNRRLRAAAILIVAVLAGIVSMGQVLRQKEIRAESLMILDGRDRVQGVFRASADGPNLSLYDPDPGPKPRLSLAVSELGPAVNLYDAAGRPRATLVVGADGQAQLAMLDENGRALRMEALEPDRFLTPEQKALLGRLATEIFPELRKVNNTLADLDDRTAEIEDWIAKQPPAKG
jgi:hypothetical protein